MAKNAHHGPCKRHNEEKENNPARLELLLRLEENFRICLEPIQMTPLQAGALLFLSRYAETKLVLHIEPRVCQVNATLTGQDRRTLGMIPKSRRAETLARSFEAFL
jgi:hypothetical protein